MNTLDDLRSTLDQHAADLHDTGHHARSVAVHARIRAVRRRRAAAVAVAAALVLVGGVAAVASLRSPGTPQPVAVLGVDVPRTIDVDGFPYAVSELEELGDDGLHLKESGEERAATLVATGLGSGSATLYSGDQAIARVRGTEHSAAPVRIGDADTDLRVELHGATDGARTGVAVYEATGELAEGVTNADRTSVFRDEVAGNPLIAGAFSTPGENDVRLEVSGSANDMRFAFYCAGDEDLYVNVSLDGDGPMASSCGDAHRDAGVGTSVTFDEPVPGSDHDVRVYLTDGPEGPEIAAPDDVEFGVGIYLRSSLDQQVAGQRVDARVEYLGRTWELARVEDAPTTIETDGGDVLLGFAADGSEVGVSWDGRLLDGEDGAVHLTDGGYTSTAGLLLAGDTYDVRTDGDAAEAKLLVYRPL